MHFILIDENSHDTAKELNIDNIDIKYHYTGGFDITLQVQTLASSWYTDGTEIIFVIKSIAFKQCFLLPFNFFLSVIIKFFY